MLGGREQLSRRSLLRARSPLPRSRRPPQIRARGDSTDGNAPRRRAYQYHCRPVGGQRRLRRRGDGAVATREPTPCLALGGHQLEQLDLGQRRLLVLARRVMLLLLVTATLHAGHPKAVLVRPATVAADPAKASLLEGEVLVAPIKQAGDVVISAVGYTSQEEVERQLRIVAAMKEAGNVKLST